MQFIIIWPYGKRVYAVSWIELNTQVGNFVVLEGHAPTLVTLTPGQTVTFGLTNGKRESLVVQQGIAHITQNVTTLLMNTYL